ncbi:MAG: hypothetical protein GY756_08975 [bacterium]|nr:hypothetical protein [bacterium]
MKFTKNDKIITVIFSIISIFSFFTLTAFHIFNIRGIGDPKLFRLIKLNDPYIYLNLSCFIGFLGLLYISLKGVFLRHYNKSKKSFFRITTIIILCFMYVYNPFFYVVPFYPGAIFWIVVHFTGIVLIIIFLMKTLSED